MPRKKLKIIIDDDKPHHLFEIDTSQQLCGKTEANAILKELIRLVKNSPNLRFRLIVRLDDYKSHLQGELWAKK